MNVKSTLPPFLTMFFAWSQPDPLQDKAAQDDSRHMWMTTQRLSPPPALRYGWLAGPVFLLAYWAAASASGLIDTRILPAPWVVVSTGVDLVHDGRLLGNLLISLVRAVEGFVIGGLAGIALALLSGLSRAGDYFVDGIAQVKRAVPAVALIPFFILWFGVDEGMKIMVIAVGAFTPVYLHTHTALRAIDIRYVELAETLRIGYWKFVWHIVLPGALPGMMLGLRFGVMAALLGLVVVEEVNATSGIGYMIDLARTYAQSDVMLVGLVTYVVIGVIADQTLLRVERRVLSWRRTLAA
ncbi:MAG: ABC transporter permease [Novacetimonas hansenii]|uniref:ABC transporter permease n=1 Tax=Novacetimonas hansenii TaxID=436 RepID=UPI0039E847D8